MSRRARANPAYSARLKRNGNVSLSSDYGYPNGYRRRVSVPVVKEDTQAASRGLLRGRVGRVVVLAGIQLITGLKCRRQLDALHRHRGFLIRNFADPAFGIPRGVQETSGSLDAASR